MSAPLRIGLRRRGALVAMATLLCSCIPVSIGSRVSLQGELPPVLPIEPGEAVLVCGEDATIPGDPLAPYFTGGGRSAFTANGVETLRLTLLQINPSPARFAVKGIDEFASDSAPTRSVGDPIFARAGISAAKASAGGLRYVIYVHETVDATVYVPLYLVPFGVAVCGNETILEASVFEAQSGQPVGSLKATANGEYVLVAYLLHVLVRADTQQDARRRMAEVLVARLTGPRP